MALKHRWAKDLLTSALRTFRVVSVVGARQSGKTTLVRYECPIPSEFRSLDIGATHKAALDDPAFFVERKAGKSLVIDEIQKAPLLIGEIKVKVDENPQKGQYILTGSSDFRKLPQANESLAGRIGFVRVRNFTESEFRGKQATLLERLFREDIPESCSPEDCNKRLILSLTEKGGFFEPQELSAEDRRNWYRSYIDQQILLDMRNLWGTRSSDTIKDCFDYLAAYSSKLLTTQSISGLFNVSWPTIEKYLSAIEAMFLVDRVPAWTKKDYDRPGKKPKLFMTDTGLMCSLLGIVNTAQRIEDLDFSQNEGGKLVETWAYNQLASEVDLHPLWAMFHLRTKAHEIDFLIEDGERNYLAIDVKSSQRVNSDDFKHIRWFQELEGLEHCIGIVLYSGNEVLSFGKRCYAIPFAALWMG